MAEYSGPDRRRFTREPKENQVEFYFDEDIVAGNTEDYSAKGIRIETDKPFRIFLRTMIDGEIVEREARIVWARSRLNGRMVYGFEYIPVSEGNL